MYPTKSVSPLPTYVDYSTSNQYRFLRDFENAYKKLPRPGRKARDPTNPQRMIIENFLEENNKYVKGRCMEFDEFIFMDRFKCKDQERKLIHKILQNRIVITQKKRKPFCVKYT